MATPLASGTYRIENARHRNVVNLGNSNRGTPLTSRSDHAERWIITALPNGRYTIRNVQDRSFAGVVQPAGMGQEVREGDEPQEWDITETGNEGEYTIVATDTDLGWALANRNSETNVTLADDMDDLRNRWMFVAVSENPRPNPPPPPNPTGVTPWPEAPRAGELQDGEYTIRNRFTNHQWALWDGSNAEWTIAPLLLFNGNPGHANTERRFRVDVNRQTGAVEITSSFYVSGRGPRRWLSDGPNLRPEMNECRLYGVPGMPLNFFICTDMGIRNSTVKVLEDIHAVTLDRLLPISRPLDPRETKQQWVFTRV